MSIGGLIRAIVGLFFGHALREQTRGEPARLQHDDLATCAEKTVAPEHLWNLRGFSRARGSLHDQAPGTAQRGDDRGLEFVDGKIARSGHDGERADNTTRCSAGKRAATHASPIVAKGVSLSFDPERLTPFATLGHRSALSEEKFRSPLGE